ncbi:MAG: hypothetical protein JNM56_11535 [Planctomycetia bacterium]|nr:hypothetical protein [Planctomycetia bacterium]
MTCLRFHPGAVCVVACLLSVLILTLAWGDRPAPHTAICGVSSTSAPTSDGDVDWLSLLLPWRCPDPVTVILGTLLWQLYFTWLGTTLLLAWEWRHARAVPAGLLAALHDAARQGQPRMASYLARLDGSHLGRVLATALARPEDGLEEARAAGFRAARSIKEAQERRLIWLEWIGTLGPLVGLAAAVQAAALLGS